MFSFFLSRRWPPPILPSLPPFLHVAVVLSFTSPWSFLSLPLSLRRRRFSLSPSTAASLFLHRSPFSLSAADDQVFVANADRPPSYGQLFGEDVTIPGSDGRRGSGSGSRSGSQTANYHPRAPPRGAPRAPPRGPPRGPPPPPPQTEPGLKEDEADNPDDHIEAPPPANPPLMMRISEFLRQPGRETRVRVLHPFRPPGTLWFSDNHVLHSVTKAIVAHFTMPHTNLSQTPQSVRDIWFESWAQVWHWDEFCTFEVRAAFEQKALKRLNGYVGNLKKAWRAKDDEPKPIGMDPDAWPGLVQFWEDLRSVVKSVKCSASRLTPVAEGDGPSKHCAGQSSYATVRLNMADGGDLHLMVKVMEKTHRKKDGTFVTAQAGKTFNAYNVRLAELDEYVQSTMGVEDLDRLYEEVAPKKKRRTMGVGSIRDVPAAFSSARCSYPPGSSEPRLTAQLDAANAEIVQLRTEQAKLRNTNSYVVSQLGTLTSLFDIIAVDNPTLATALQSKPRPPLRPPPHPPPTCPTQFEEESEEMIREDTINLRTQHQ